MLDLIVFYFSQPFIWFAMIVLVLVSLCASLLGSSLVLKRFSMIGDGLSHVAFGASAIAAAFNFAPMAVTIPITVVAAVLLLRINNNSRIKGDSAIAMISSGALAIGYLIMNLFPGSSTNLSGDACTTLFGSASILGLTKTDVITCVVLAAAAIAVVLILWLVARRKPDDSRLVDARGVSERALERTVTGVKGMTESGKIVYTVPVDPKDIDPFEEKDEEQTLATPVKEDKPDEGEPAVKDEADPFE